MLPRLFFGAELSFFFGVELSFFLTKSKKSSAPHQTNAERCGEKKIFRRGGQEKNIKIYSEDFFSGKYIYHTIGRK